MSTAGPRRAGRIEEKQYRLAQCAGKVIATDVGLRFPSNLSYDEWARAGNQVARIASSSAWFIGDWVACGQNRYESRYREAVEAAGLEYHTIRNYVWVARRFELRRRRVNLSFQHHAEVASLSPDDQDHWLARAEESGWSRNQLRRQIQHSRDAGRRQADHEVVQPLKVDRSRAARWLRAAQHSGNSLEAWILTSLDSAASEALAEAESPEERTA